jgi:hypothetical protein
VLYHEHLLHGDAETSVVEDRKGLNVVFADACHRLSSRWEILESVVEQIGPQLFIVRVEE